jgi:elongator complex protein 1
LSAIRDVKEAAVAHTAHSQQQLQSPIATAPAAAAGDSSTTSATVTAADLSSPAELSAAADAALKHLLLYVDVDQLYQAALGLYDLPLAFMVVSHSQKDPGEYLSELSGFGSISDVHMQRHAIDMSLGRYPKAVEHLVAAGPTQFDAALKLARERGLLRQLLALTQQQQQQQQHGLTDGSGGGSGVLSVQQRLVAVLSAYGDMLMDTRKAEDAAVAYHAAGRTEQALNAYR